MRTRNGFTLVELLAVMILLGLLMVLTIPAYTSIYTAIKRTTYQNKIVEIANASKKYGSKIKDAVKDAGDSCYRLEPAQLIREGYLTSDIEGEPAFLDPTDQSKLNGEIRICYCTSDFDIEAYYVEEFHPSGIYYEGDVVLVTNGDNISLYQCKMDYKLSGGSINSEEKGKRYFEKLTC